MLRTQSLSIKTTCFVEELCRGEENVKNTVTVSLSLLKLHAL